MSLISYGHFLYACGKIYHLPCHDECEDFSDVFLKLWHSEGDSPFHLYRLSCFTPLFSPFSLGPPVGSSTKCLDLCCLGEWLAFRAWWTHQITASECECTRQHVNWINYTVRMYCYILLRNTKNSIHSWSNKYSATYGDIWSLHLTDPMSARSRIDNWRSCHPYCFSVILQCSDWSARNRFSAWLAMTGDETISVRYIRFCAGHTLDIQLKKKRNTIECCRLLLYLTFTMGILDVPVDTL